MKNPVATVGFHQQAQGFARCLVVDAKTKQVKRDYGWQKNLILNQGMDYIGANAGGTGIWANEMSFAVAGIGTTPTADDSGVSTIAQVGTAVSVSGGSFTFTDTGTDVGKMIKWDTGEEARILSVQSPTSATVANFASVSASEFTVYRTNQTGLFTERKRSNSYLPGAGNCGTALIGNVLKLRRTYDFTTEAGSVTYTEIGFSHTGTVSNNLFSRIRLTLDVTVNVGELLRVIYELQVTVGQMTQEAFTPSIPGWSDTSGVGIMNVFGYYVIRASDGAAVWLHGSQNHGMDPGDNTSMLLYYSNSTASLPAATDLVTGGAGSPPNYFGDVTSPMKAGLALVYTPLSFTCTKSAIWIPSEGNFAGIRTVVYGYYYSSYGVYYYPCYVFRFDNPHEKTNIQTLTLRMRFTWSRVLG